MIYGNNKNSFEDKFERLLSAAEVAKPAELARVLGLTPQAVNSVIKRKKIPGDWVEQIANSFNVSSDWLFFGDSSKEKVVDGEQFVYIPRVEARLAAGAGSLDVSESVIEELAFKREWMRTKGNPKNMVLMAVSGDSMEPIIKDKDLVLIDQSKQEIRPSKIFAVGFEEYIFVKRLILEPGKLILRSENTYYNDIHINLRDEDISDQVRIIGRVIWWCHDER